ncbi:MAG: DUF642 domain-containing protein [Rhodospirillaceae bacterium]
MSSYWRHGVTALAAALLAPIPATAQVTNGSFETPVVPAGSFTLFNSGSSAITGWTVVGPQVAIVSGTFTQSGITFPAQSGSQWLDLTGLNANSTEGVQQSIATLPGSVYNVSFWVGNVVNAAAGFGTSSTVNVLANGVSIGSAINASGTATTQTWLPFTLQFTASGTTTTLAFMNADPVSDNTNGLDNISVALAGAPPIPEPGTMLLLATGLLTFGGWARRRL